MFPRTMFGPKWLELWTTAGDDGSRDHFSSPKELRWSAALGKLLVANGGTTVNFHVRNADLSYASKFYIVAAPAGQIAADDNNMYLGYSGYAIRKCNLDFSNIVAFTTVIPLNYVIRMFEASDPDYLYVTIASTGHHGVVKIRKSDMTVVASIEGAAGAGDGQFNNPLGVFYYNGIVYVVDFTNSRIVELNASDLSYITEHVGWSTVSDLATDGVNWYVQTTNNLYKRDMSFGAISSIATNGYSLTIIPDQNDGNGQTIAVCSSTNSNLKRHKCSDLTLINTVGTSGDGSASLFDPTLTTSVATTVTYQMDDGFSYTTASGTSHALSKDGFAGYTFRNAGPHRCTIRVNGGLGLVTVLDCNTDAITSVKNVRRLNNLATCNYYTNPGLSIPFSEFPGSVTLLNSANNGFGSLAGLPRGLLGLYSSGSDARITGNVIDFPRGMTAISCTMSAGAGLIAGNLSDVPSTITNYLYLGGNSSIVAGSISHVVGMQNVVLSNIGWNSASVDTVLLSISDAIHANVNHFTYATPSLQIGGTNAAPGGTESAATTSPLITPGTGASNSDWLWDANAYGGELLLNPGFETWISATDAESWSEDVTDGTISRESSVIMDGTYALKLISGAALTTSVYQTVTVVPGSSYRYSFWTRGDGTNAGVYAVRDITNSANIRSNTSTGISGTTYTLVSYDFVAPAGCVSVRVRLYGPAVGTAYAYFDNASLKQLTPKHKALTGMAAIYVMRSNTGHVWSVSATGVGGAEMLANGDFETWASDTVPGSWSKTTLAGSVNKEATVILDGTYAAKLVSGGGTWSQTRAYQDLVTVAGSTYKLQFWTRGDGTNAGEFAIEDRSHSNYIREHITTGVTGTTYTLVEYSYTAPSGCVLVRVSLTAPVTDTTYCYYDNVSHRLVGGA